MGFYGEKAGWAFLLTFFPIWLYHSTPSAYGEFEFIHLKMPLWGPRHMFVSHWGAIFLHLERKLKEGMGECKTAKGKACS